MLRRRLQPKSDHALFFPLGTGKVVIGQPEWIWPWQEYDFHQVELGDFHLVVEYGSNKSVEAARSKDGLLFTVKVFFEVVVDVSVDALRKATRRRTPTRDSRVAISHKDFAELLQGSLRRVVASALSEREYLPPKPISMPAKSPPESSPPTRTSNSEFRKSLDLEIERVARTVLTDKEGFTLLRCEVLEVTPETPSAHTLAQNSELREKWNWYSQHLITIEEESQAREEKKIADKKQRERELQEYEDKQNADAQVRRNELLNGRDDLLGALADKMERQKLERLEALEQRKLENSKAMEQIKQQRITAQQQTELVAAQEAGRVHQTKLEIEGAQLRAKNTAELERLSAERSRLEQELSLMDLRLKAAEGECAVASQKSKELETVGQAEAAVTRAKILAANAESIELNQELLKALPGILETAGAASPKPTEMKVMYIAGQPGSSASSESSLGSLLSTASTLGLLREILQFVGSWSGSSTLAGQTVNTKQDLTTTPGLTKSP
jgi:hypothetical protein